MENKEQQPEKQQPEKPQRSVADVQREYNSGCLRAGHIQYQIVTLQKDLDILNGTLRDLNFEASKLQNQLNEDAAKKAKEEAEKAAPAEMPKLEGLNNG